MNFTVGQIIESKELHNVVKVGKVGVNSIQVQMMIKGISSIHAVGDVYNIHKPGYKNWLPVVDVGACETYAQLLELMTHNPHLRSKRDIPCPNCKTSIPTPTELNSIPEQVIECPDFKCQYRICPVHEIALESHEGVDEECEACSSYLGSFGEKQFNEYSQEVYEALRR